MEPRGLLNLGNSCYINVAIQALRLTRPFSQYFCSSAWRAHHHEDRKHAAFAVDTAALVRAFSADARSPIPRARIEAFVRHVNTLLTEFRPGHQSDATDVLGKILEVLHEQQSRKVRMEISGEALTPELAEYSASLSSWSTYFNKEYSMFIENYFGQTRLQTHCSVCSHTFTRYEPWSVLTLPIRSGTLEDCLDAQLGSETITDYRCDKCKSVGTCETTQAISRFPRILFMSFKRFTNTGAKIRGIIPYDVDNVDLTKWSAWSDDLCQKSTYTVVSVIDQFGNQHGGHYSLRSRMTGTGAWVLFDDAAVTPVANGNALADTYLIVLQQRA